MKLQKNMYFTKKVVKYVLQKKLQKINNTKIWLIMKKLGNTVFSIFWDLSNSFAIT